MDVFEKLKILTDAAKYDVACTSSGVTRSPGEDGIGSAVSYGICHSFAGDGRCISLLKILMSNACVYDCKYCVNRVSNDTQRATFTPREIAELTINFYRRNFIEGLFLSSGVIGTPDRTVDLMCEALRLLREEYKFYGYIHAKAIPGADKDALRRLGLYADRLSVNIEMPSEASLKALAPDKAKQDILQPMAFIRDGIKEGKQIYLNGSASLNNTLPAIKMENEIVKAGSFNSKSSRFAPAGQSTQMIVGASPESDLQILRLTEGLYNKFQLKRVFFSAYIPVAENSLLPSLDSKPPLLREHRLYQADWLLRFYGFKAAELLDEQNPTFNQFLDPKCNWAVNHLEHFPIEINTAPYELLLRVPGIGVLGAKKIILARRNQKLGFDSLKKLGVVLKRAQYFILCSGKTATGVNITEDGVLRSLLSSKAYESIKEGAVQLSMFDSSKTTEEEIRKCITGQL